MALSFLDPADCHLSFAAGLRGPHLHFLFGSLHVQAAQVSGNGKKKTNK